MRVRVACSCFILAAWAAAQGTVLRVPAQFPTIAAAVRAAGPGTTILVAPGYYPEAGIQIAVAGLTIRGTGGPLATVVDGGGRGPIFRITGRPGLWPVVIEGLTLTRGVHLAPGGGGAIAWSGQQVVLRNLIFFRNRAQLGGGWQALPS